MGEPAESFPSANMARRERMIAQTVAIFPEQHAIAVRAVEAVVLWIAPLRVLAPGKTKGIADEFHHRRVAHLVGQGHQHQLQVANQQGLEQPGSLALAQAQLQARVVAQRRRLRAGSRNGAMVGITPTLGPPASPPCSPRPKPRQLHRLIPPGHRRAANPVPHGPRPVPRVPYRPR